MRSKCQTHIIIIMSMYRDYKQKSICSKTTNNQKNNT